MASCRLCLLIGYPCPCSPGWLKIDAVCSDEGKTASRHSVARAVAESSARWEGPGWPWRLGRLEVVVVALTASPPR